MIIIMEHHIGFPNIHLKVWNIPSSIKFIMYYTKYHHAHIFKEFFLDPGFPFSLAFIIW